MIKQVGIISSVVIMALSIVLNILLFRWNMDVQKNSKSLYTEIDQLKAQQEDLVTELEDLEHQVASLKELQKKGSTI